MLEIIGKDIFGEISTSGALCITTNCTISDDGSNPMGAMAGAAAQRWPVLPAVYGAYLSFMPHVPVVLGYVNKKIQTAFTSSITALQMKDRYINNDYCAIVAYPTMEEFGAPASLDLVIRSANLLVEMADLFGWKRVVQGRAGCGIGGLSYEKQVKPRIEVIFDNRFIIMHK